MIKPKVVVLVKNSIIMDYRVLNEASILSENGYDVVIIGVKSDNRFPCNEQLLNGTSIVRISWVKEFIDFYGLMLAMTLTSIMSLGIAASIFYRYCEPFLKVLLYLSPFLIISILFYCLFEKILLSVGCKYKFYFNHIIQEVYLNYRIYSELRNQKPHIVHCHDYDTLAIGCKYRRKHNCKLVYDSHEIYSEMSYIKQQWMLKKTISFREKYLFSRYIDAFITVNDALAKYFRENYRLLPEPRVITNARCVNSSLTKNKLFHKKLNLPANSKIALYHGQITSHRNLDVIINSAKHLSADWIIIFMGWGDYTSQLKDAARYLPRPEQIYFLPGIEPNRLLEWVSAADVGISTITNSCLNHKYCTPNKFWECLAAGVPYLCTEGTTEISKMISKYNIGWILNSDNSCLSKALADKLNHLTLQEIQTKKSNISAFNEVYSWKHSADILLSLYNRIR